jgi:hypothetical protein
MNIHTIARLTPLGRERMVRAIVEGGQAAARAAGVCPHRAQMGLQDGRPRPIGRRSSRPQRLR